MPLPVFDASVLWSYVRPATMTVHVKTANIGLTIPLSLLARADEVVE
jgi:hypothetical protein